MTVGRVSALWRYPVKSFRGESLEFAPVGPDGIPGDRGVAVVDAESGRVISAKRVHALISGRAVARPGGPVLCLPDGRAISYDAPEAADVLSEWLGRRVRLEVQREGSERPLIEDEQDHVFWGRPGGFHDGHHLHLLTTATLMHLKSLHPDGEWDARRFRPNIVLEVEGTGPVEQDWIGRTLRIGDVELEIIKGCTRCVMTTLEQDELPQDREILGVVAREQDNVVGVKATVRAPGSIALGDEARLEPIVLD